MRLAETWCDKMGHCYSLYLEQDKDDYVYTVDDCASWEPPEGLGKMLVELTGAPRQRVIDLLEQVPSHSL